MEHVKFINIYFPSKVNQINKNIMFKKVRSSKNRHGLGYYETRKVMVNNGWGEPEPCTGTDNGWDSFSLDNKALSDNAKEYQIETKKDDTVRFQFELMIEDFDDNGRFVSRPVTIENRWCPASIKVKNESLEVDSAANVNAPISANEKLQTFLNSWKDFMPDIEKETEDKSITWEPSAKVQEMYWNLIQQCIYSSLKPQINIPLPALPVVFSTKEEMKKLLPSTHAGDCSGLPTITEPENNAVEASFEDEDERNARIASKHIAYRTKDTRQWTEDELVFEFPWSDGYDEESEDSDENEPPAKRQKLE